MSSEGFVQPERKEALERLRAWLDESEKQVDRGEITDLERNVNWAKKYEEMGLHAEAIQAYGNAADQAFEERKDEVMKECEAKIEKLSTAMG